MTERVRCRSLRGHKYEPRYDKSASNGVNFQNISRCSEAFVENLVEKSRDVKYVRDVCVRCGHTIERVQP